MTFSINRHKRRLHHSQHVYGFGMRYYSFHRDITTSMVPYKGQIEHMGSVSEIVPLDRTESGGGGWSITISDAAPVLNDCHIGDSICCNGACLTVTEFTTSSFKVGVAPETLDRTNLGKDIVATPPTLLNSAAYMDRKRRSEG